MEGDCYGAYVERFTIRRAREIVEDLKAALVQFQAIA